MSPIPEVAASTAQGAPTPRAVAAMERLLAANSTELTRADTKAAVLLGFAGAALGVFVPLSRKDGAGSAVHGWDTRLLWWTAVLSALCAVGCFLSAIAPRHRKGRGDGASGPGYFEHIGPDAGRGRLGRAFEHVGRDPAGPLLASLVATSAIIRAKYRWIEAGTVLLLLALPQFAALLRPV
ncbi:Pycsar system effector family protein [Kitasatospora purpeofusca]|uniref:Pycsar system effector family protein n=1 Tax=Kitasatospora purpeofusca TaxID=67352 RepID=UPI0036D32561